MEKKRSMTGSIYNSTEMQVEFISQEKKIAVNLEYWERYGLRLEIAETVHWIWIFHASWSCGGLFVLDSILFNLLLLQIACHVHAWVMDPQMHVSFLSLSGTRVLVFDINE